MMSIKSFLLSTLATACLCISPVLAQEILIDLGRNDNTTASNYNNVSALPSTNFTSIGDFPTINNLIDNTGASTGISFDLASVANVEASSGLGIGGFSQVPSPNNSGFVDTAARDTMFLLAHGSTNTATFKLSDLKTDGTTYSLNMYGFIGNQDRILTEWTVGGSTQQLDPKNNTDTVVSFANVLPTGGDIDIDFTATDDPNTPAFAQSHWNAFEIVDDSTQQSLLVEFGRDDAATGANYNDASGPANVSWGVGEFPALTDMVDSIGGSTPYDFDFVSISNPLFGPAGPIGTGIAGFSSAPNPNGSGFENSAAADSLLTNGTADATFEFANLTPGMPYNLDFYGYITADRTLMEIEVNGELKTLDVQNNLDGVLSFTNIIPDGNGKIAFTLGAGPDGGGVRQTQLGAIRLTGVPEPTSCALAAGMLLALLAYRPGKIL